MLLTPGLGYSYANEYLLVSPCALVIYVVKKLMHSTEAKAPGHSNFASWNVATGRLPLNFEPNVVLLAYSEISKFTRIHVNTRMYRRNKVSTLTIVSVSRNGPEKNGN